MKTKLLLLFLLISTSIFAQNATGTQPKMALSKYFELFQGNKNISYFEVSGEMFKMMSEANGPSNEFKENIRKLTSLKVIKSNNDEDSEGGYYFFLDRVDLKDFTLLMKSSQPNKKVSFYKKENKNSENEYLLVSTKMTIFLRGSKSIG